MKLAVLLARFLPRKVATIVETAPRNRLTDEAWGEAVRIATARAYIQGAAEGELRGRMALARELEIAFGEDSGHDLKAEDIPRIQARQIH